MRSNVSSPQKSLASPQKTVTGYMPPALDDEATQTERKCDLKLVAVTAAIEY